MGSERYEERGSSIQRVTIEDESANASVRMSESSAKAYLVDALQPVSGLVWQYDKIGEYLMDTLADKLRHVPHEKIQSPSPIVAVPAMEALRFTAHEPSLRELYANLIATSMNADKCKKAHPGFVDVIRQLTPDEALIVSRFEKRWYHPLVSLLYRTSGSEGFKEFRTHFALLGYECGCANPEMISTFLDNFTRLGIIEIRIDQHLTGDSEYTPLETHSVMVDAKTTLEADGRSVEFRRELLRVTEWGRHFCAACLSETR